MHFDQGPGGPIFALARRYLPPGHPLRSRNCTYHGLQFEFRNVEARGPPAIKTTQSIFKLVALARARNVTHFLGQKGPPMFSTLSGFRYHFFNPIEWMHNLARAFDNFNDLLVGRDANFDARARSSSQALGIFPDLWPARDVNLSQARTSALANLHDGVISSGNSTWCRRWLRVCGITPPAGTRVRDLRERVSQLRDMAVNGEPIVVAGAVNPLPYRLSAAARIVVNRRVVNISYPHYTPVCHVGNDSFINKSGCWRTASKLIAFLVVLIPVLRGFVIKFRTGLRFLILGLRILEGQTLSVNECDALHLERGFKALEKTRITEAKTLIILGLSMIEGCAAVCCLVPGTHSLCHFGGSAAIFGLLRLLWMICFGLYVHYIICFDCRCKIFTLFIVSTQRDSTKSVKILLQIKAFRSKVSPIHSCVTQLLGISDGADLRVRQER